MNEMPQNKHEADEMIGFMVNIDDLVMLLVNMVDNFSPEQIKAAENLLNAIIDGLIWDERYIIYVCNRITKVVTGKK